MSKKHGKSHGFPLFSYGSGDMSQPKPITARYCDYIFHTSVERSRASDVVIGWWLPSWKRKTGGFPVSQQSKYVKIIRFLDFLYVFYDQTSQRLGHVSIWHVAYAISSSVQTMWHAVLAAHAAWWSWWWASPNTFTGLVNVLIVMTFNIRKTGHVPSRALKGTAWCFGLRNRSLVMFGHQLRSVQCFQKRLWSMHQRYAF